jgi:TIR domain
MRRGFTSREARLMGDAAVPIPGRVFISYRREETAYPAGWLYDRLAGRYGGQVFKDVDSIQLGDDFVEVITRAVASCDVLLALVGDQWLTITDADGGRRLDNPDDFVRLEIEAALTRNVRVIPILVDGARMPRADELPPSLAGLVRRQALELSPARFDFDTSRLLKVLDRTLVEVRAANDDAAVAAAAAPNAPEQSTTQLPPIQASGSEAPTTRTDRTVELYDDPEYTAALAAYFTERWHTAVDLMTRVLEKHPDHPQITDRLAEARRQQQLTAWDADARRAAEQGRWAAAVDALERIAAEAPDLPDTASRLEHARTQQRISRLRDDLRRLYTAEQWLAVMAVSEQLAEIDPQLADPDGLVTATHAALADAALADRYNTGLQQLDQADRAAAAATFAAIDAERPGYRDTRALLARARQHHPSAPTVTSMPAPLTPAGTPSEPVTEGTPIPVTRLSAEPPHPDEIETAEGVREGTPGGRDERRLWMGAGVAIGSAVLIVVGLFLPYQGGYRIVEQDYGSPWYAYALVVAALVTSAGVCMLSGSAGWLSGAGILLGTVAASSWGLAFSVSKLTDGDLHVGFWVELIAHLFLVLAAWLTVLALWRSAGVRLVLRPPRGVSGWLVALFGVAGAVTLVFHVVELAETGSFVWFGWWSLAPAVVLTVMALVVPVGAAIAVPRRFGVAVLVGWIGVAASVLLYYVDVLASWYIRGPIVAFGLTLVGLGLAAIPFARAAQPPQEPAERPLEALS